MLTHSCRFNRKHCVLVNKSTTLHCHAEANFAVHFVFAFTAVINILYRPSIESGKNQCVQIYVTLWCQGSQGESRTCSADYWLALDWMQTCWTGGSILRQIFQEGSYWMAYSDRSAMSTLSLLFHYCWDFNIKPIQALEHPKFKEMIDIVARATNSVKIPRRKATRAEIMWMFKNHLTKLKKTLNVWHIYLYFVGIIEAPSLF